MRYFVTGATGFIGGEVARRLLQAGHQVVALVRDPSRAEALAGAGAEVHTGDISDKESMRAPMQGVDGIFHIAAWYKVGARDSHLAERMNVEGTRNVLELMRELGVPRGVYTSTLAVFGDTHGKLVDESYYHAGPWASEYDRTKWLAHYQVALPMMKEGLPLTIVQPGMVYGPGDAGPAHDIWVQYLTRRLPVVPARAAYCWGHVADTAQGHIQAMERGKPGESYIIAGPPHTLVDVLSLAHRITGVRPPRLRVPPALLRAASRLMGLVGRVAPLPANFSAEYLRVSAGLTYLGTNARARRELGFDPRPLEAGLRETLGYELARLARKP